MPLSITNPASPQRPAAPGSVEAAYRRWGRYQLALPLSRGKRVLDLGCGDARGAAHLASVAASVEAVDDADATLADAREAHADVEKLSFVRAPPEAFVQSSKDASYDVVLAFELLPLLEKRGQGALVRGIKRILAPGGVALFSSADRQVLVEAGSFRSSVQDMYRRDMVELLEQSFAAVRVLEERTFSGSALFAREAATAQLAELVWDDPQHAAGRPASGMHRSGDHLLAIAASDAAALDAVAPLVLLDPARLLVRDELRAKELDLEVLRRDLDQTHRSLDGARRDAEAARADLGSARGASAQVEAARRMELDKLGAELAAARAQLAQLSASSIPRQLADAEKGQLRAVIDRLLSVLSADAVELDRTLRAEAEFTILKERYHHVAHELEEERIRHRNLRGMVSVQLIERAKRVWDRAPRLKAALKRVVKPLVR